MVAKDDSNAKDLLAGPLSRRKALLQVDDLTIPVPEDTDKYYHARVTFRDGEADVKGVLFSPKRHLRIDRSGYVDRVFIFVDQSNTPAVTVDAIQSVKILGELSQAEYESVAGELKNLIDRNR